MLIPLLLVGSLATAIGPFEYDRYMLFELVLCADVIVAGEIEAVASETFEVRVTRAILGGVQGDVLEVERFENWTCAHRWTGYTAGQRVLLFLRQPAATSATFEILGGGGEGEMPLSGSDVVVRGYDVRGYETELGSVDGVQVGGARVALDEIETAVVGFRPAFTWEKGSHRDQIPAIRAKDAEQALAFEQSSRLARHLCEQARSSEAWKGPVEDEGRLIPPERLRRVDESALGCAGPERLNRECAASPFEGSNRFGALAFVGDVDGDGNGDLAAGAAWDCRTSHVCGALWILFLEPDGSVRASTEISEGRGGFPAGLNEFAQLGCALAPLGDLDGDGVPDLVVGAKGWDSPDNRRGGVWVLFLARDGTVSSSLELGATETLQRAGVGKGSGIGAALAALGDLDGDGVAEVAIGQDPDFDLGHKQGRAVWIVSLQRNGHARWARSIRAREDGFSAGSSWFGDALARVGDLDGDGTTELAIADTYDSDGGEVRGAVWVAFLAPDGSLKQKQKISDWAGGFEGRMRDWERFGHALAGPGDVDGDGVADLFVTASSGFWTLNLKRDGTVRSGALLQDPARAWGRKQSFAETIAWAGRGVSGPVLAVKGAVSDEKRGEANVAAAGDRDSPTERDLIWYFALDESGQIVPW